MPVASSLKGIQGTKRLQQTRFSEVLPGQRELLAKGCATRRYEVLLGTDARLNVTCAHLLHVVEGL